MSIKAAFNLLINLHGRQMNIFRHQTAYAATIKVSPSNYFRNLEVANAIVSKGREFVLSKEQLDVGLYPVPKRGDKLDDSELGVMTLTEVREMYDLGGSIIGYRVRTD